MNSLQLIQHSEKELKLRFEELDEIAYENQIKVLNAFRSHQIRDIHFSSSSGYGYGDIGRDDLEKVYADIFQAGDALVRSQIVSGTHAISACLLGLLRPGEELVSVVGSPYDTLCSVIGKTTPSRGTLIERGIKYAEVSLDEQGRPDFEAIRKRITSHTRMVLIQRSRGYSLRPALTMEDLTRLIECVRLANPDTIIFVDNCYGEFTDLEEPLEIGADLMAGSLIKNPGGGLALSGGYIVGKKSLVEEVADHITAPCLGKELGASLASNRLLYQGLFMAPHVVLQAMKGAVLLSHVFEQMGYEVYPRWSEPRGDIVQAIKMDRAEDVIQFAQLVQNYSPIDSDVNLEFADLPGYENQVVMAAGTFVQGSSIELSCDAPLRSPYCIYLQGGLSYEHTRFVTANLIEKFSKK